VLTTSVNAIICKLCNDLKSEEKLILVMRYIAGFSGLALLLIGTVLIIIDREASSWESVTASSIPLLIGGILLLMAIKPEQVTACIDARA
jgi:hypothetical protein